MGRIGKQKLGAGHASAMFRQGLSELRAAFYPQGSNIAQPTEHGMYGTKTPGEVMEEKQGENRDPNEKPSVLKDRMLKMVGAYDSRDPEYRKEPERDRE